MSRLAKLTDLFVEGRAVKIQRPSGEPILVWINKLSPFELEQCNHEGRIARARTMLAIRQIGTPEYDLFRASAQASKPDAIITALIQTKSNEHLVSVIRDMHSDPEWKEKLETLEWSSEQLDGKSNDDPEVKALAQVLADYQAEMDARTTFLRNELRQELAAMPEDSLREAYLESYIEQRGLQSFTREREITQVFYTLRQCEGVDQGEGTYTHENCTHQRWLEDRRDVESLPSSLLGQIREAIEDVNMAPDVARFSDALVSSSDSSGPSSKQEDSAVSGQTETSVEQGGTSSSQ
jgi:hypothetical protein